MSSTTLRAYLDELESLMETEALEEVIGHCRHILQHFPKNVETYRVLGRALLDKSRFPEAGDVFQRVLSVYPSDFVAHLGMSSVSEEQGQIPAAVWHLERAFEQDPNNPALHDELKRLIEKRDGSAPERIQLTRGGLAHLYAKGRLYDQAVLELQSTLAQMAERIDLWLLLAQVLWESERPVEAADVALRVLEHLPNSVEANRIMAELWLKGGRPSDAAPFINRLEQLDPFLAWQVVNSDGKPLPPKAFQLPHLDWDARAAAALTSDVPDWVNAIGNVFDAPQSVSLSGGVTDWLADSEPAPPLVAPPEPAPQPSKPSSMLSKKMAEVADDTPDWFKESQTSATDEVPDWFKEPASESTAVSDDDVPDWFTNDTPVEPETQTPAATIPPVQDWFSQEPASASQAALPSWLDDDDMPSLDDLTAAPDSEQMPSGFTDLLAGSESRSGSGMAPSASSASIPDWLADEEPAPTDQAMDAMSWLATGPLPSLEESAPIQQSQQAGQSSSDFGDLGDLDSFFGESATTQAQLESTQSTADDDDPLGWLQSVPSESSTPVQSSESVSASDWLSSTSVSEPEPAEEDPLGWMRGTTTELAQEAEPVTSGGLDWLDAAPASTDSAVDDDPLGWMNQGSETTEATPAGEQTSTDPLGWMHGYDTDFELEPEQPSSLETALAQDLGIDLEDSKSQSGKKLRPGEIDVSDLNLGSLATTALPANSLDWLNQEDTDEEDDDADQWLSKFMPGDAASRPAAPPASQPTIELEDDWLASFESTSIPTPSTQEQGDVGSWLTSSEAELTTDSALSGGASASTTDSWFSSLEQTPEQSTTQTGSVDDFFSTLGTPASDAVPELSGGDDWSAGLDFDSFESSNEEPGPAGDMPDWMRGMAPIAPPTAPPKTSLDALDFSSLDAVGSTDSAFETETADTGKKNFEDLIKNIDQSKERPHIETGVLDPGTLPDWLTGVDESVAASSALASTDLDSLDDFDFESDIQDEEPIAGEAPDWLSNMAPAASTTAPKSSLDDLDFGSLDSVGDSLEAGDTADWLSNMAPATPAASSEVAKKPLGELNFGSLDSSPVEQSSTSSSEDAPDWLSGLDESAEVSTPAGDQPPPRFDMPTTFPEIDFSDLDNDGIPDVFQRGEASPAESSEFSFKFDRVAQSSDSVNTSGESGSSSFSFKRKQPAWKKKADQSGGQASTAKSTGEDFSDWLTSDAFGSDEPDNSDPDWLK